MPTAPEMFCLWGKTGSHRRAVRTTRLTRSGSRWKNLAERGSVLVSAPDGTSIHDRRRSSRTAIPASPPGWGQQQVLHLLLPELRHEGRSVAARVLTRRDQEEATVLHALELAIHDPGLWRITLIICGIDSQEGRLYPIQAGRGVIVARRIPLIQEVIGIGGERRHEALVEQLVCQLARGRQLLVCQRSAVGGDAEEHIGHLERARLRGVVTVLPIRIVADRIDDQAPHHPIAA